MCTVSCSNLVMLIIDSPPVSHLPPRPSATTKCIDTYTGPYNVMRLAVASSSGSLQVDVFAHGRRMQTNSLGQDGHEAIIDVCWKSSKQASTDCM